MPLLGRIDHQGREENGDMSHTLTQQSWAWSDIIAKWSNIIRNTMLAPGGEPLKFCVYRFHYLGKKALETVSSSQGLEGEEEGGYSAQRKSP